MQLLAAGAAGTVTGSCHHLTLGGRVVLVDCGLFQGGADADALNREPFPFDPVGLDAVLLTHGHLDHVGRLPLLPKRGFAGPVHATRATREIAEVILRDSARLQREDVERERRRARREGGGEPPPPLYDEADVDAVLRLFVEPVAFDRPRDLGGGLSVRFGPAGHILGSAWLQLDHPDGRVVASGDLGNRESPLQAEATLPPPCDAVLVETTYADRAHRSRAATEEEFREVVRSAVARGGNVLIPTFALERTQVVLYEIGLLVEAGELEPLPVFLDAPMAARMTRLYRSCANEFRPEVRAVLEAGGDPFDPPGLRVTPRRQDSMAINEVTGGAIIIAGSGMMTGGRIQHHLKRNLPRPEASLVVVGYQARGTLGRRIVDGAGRVRIHGDDVPVRAGVHTIGGFSAHADHDDLRRWLAPTGDARVVMVHGEPEVRAGFARELEAEGRRTLLPELGGRYELA